jgi:uncharacterized repeat protein (TIGR03987 family)
MGSLAHDVLTLNFHTVTGLMAILLMLVHAVWATTVLVKKDDRARETFHHFSVIVWLIWLIPYISGAIFGMTR